MLEGYLRALVGRADAAEDLFQEVSLVVLNKAVDDLPDDDRFPAWLRGIGRNLAHKHFRTRKRRREEAWDELHDLIDQSFAEADGATWHDDERRALRRCLEQMPTRGRELLRQRYEEDCTPKDIAKRHGRTADAVRVALMRLRQSLRTCLQRAAVRP